MPPCRPTRSLGVKIGAKPRDRDVPPIRRVSTGEADAAQVERERVAAVVASRHGPAAAPLLAGHRRVWRPLLVLLAALAALNAATLALKLATGRTAPHAGIDLVFAGGWSYPSGHAVNATV